MYKAYFMAYLCVNLKNKSPLFYQQKWVYLGIAENCNSGHANYDKTIEISPTDKIEELYFMEEEVGRG